MRAGLAMLYSLLYVQCLEQCLAPNRCSINTGIHKNEASRAPWHSRAHQEATHYNEAKVRTRWDRRLALCPAGPSPGSPTYLLGPLR